jgi:serine phosphatase RsbU (regulator of sigma subunit)
MREPFEPSTTNARFNGVQIGTRIIPAAGALRGGDWCEAFAITSDIVALTIGDVCGHGVEKFETMVAVRQAIRDAALRGLDPAQTLAEAGRFLQAYDPGESATAICAWLDTRARTLTYANAGHPPPLMVGAYGSLFLEFSEADFPLGIDPESLPAVHAISAPAATLFVFYTDGVSESERDSSDGASRLRNAAHFAHAFPELSPAPTIETLILTASNADDAAILTAWTPNSPIVRNCHAKGYARGVYTRSAHAGARGEREG